MEVEKNPYLAPLAYASTALILMIFAYSMMFLTVSLPGATAILTLPSMLQSLILFDFGFLAEVMFVLTFGTPALFLFLCLYVYTALVRKKNYPGLFYATRMLSRLRHWIMVVCVFHRHTGGLYQACRCGAGAVWCGFLADVCAFGDADPHRGVDSAALGVLQIYAMQGRNAIQTASADKICCSRCLYFRNRTETTCGVCGSALFSRRPKSLSISLALLLAAAVLYIPANVLPIMISANPLKTEVSTILNGIAYMWRDGDKLNCADYFQRQHFGAHAENRVDGLSDCQRPFPPALKRAENGADLPAHRCGGRWSDD